MAQPGIVNNTNVLLIDCNRISSEEGKTNNNDNQAIFTNNISDGLKLETGDKVSVHSAYINELGCGSQTLETTGKIIGDFQYRHTEIELERGQKHIEYGPYKAKSVEVKNLVTTETVKDNEMVFTISYYKTTNGENYMHLPRRFDTNIDVLSTGTYTVPRDYLPPSGTQNIPTPIQLHTTPDTGKNDGGYQESRITARQKAWWQHDSTTSGRSYVTPIYRCLDDWTFYTGKSAYTGWSSIFNRGTIRKERKYGDPDQDLKEYYIAPEGNQDEFTPGPLRDGYEGYDVNEWRKRNDNSKYTIYMMTRTLYTEDSSNIDTQGGDDDNNDYFSKFDDLEPCWYNYIRYLELKKYEISPGFNDPNNVAYQLTSQLTDKSEPEQVELTGALNSADDPVDFDDNGRIVSEPRYDCPISMTIDGNVFKPFACANWHTFSNNNFTKYTTVQVPETDQIDYLSSYQTIGIKRPEFYDAGRDTISHNFADPENPTNAELKSWLDYRIGSQTSTKVYAETTQHWCPTTIPFTENNLKAISNFLKTQELYPELLVFNDRDTYRPTPPKSNLGLTADDVPYKSDTPALQPSLRTNSATRTNGIDNPVYEKRFLHIDGEQKSDETGYDGRVSKIGCDGYLSTDTDAKVSLPLFFHYDRNNEDKDSTMVSGLDEFNLVYGFASSYLDDTSGVKCIRLYLKDGIPDEIATQGGTAGEPEKYISGRGIGFDRHFNAYGNAAIMLYSGMFPENYFGNEKISAPSLVGGSTIGEIRESTNNSESQTLQFLGEAQAWEISKYIRQIYLGAISPIIKFDSAQSRFVFNGLHTPEYIQNEADAGFKSSDTATPVPETEDAGAEVYKINKVLTLTNNFCPDMLPYRQKSSYKAPFNPEGTEFANVPGPTAGGQSPAHSNSTLKITRVCGYGAAKDINFQSNNYPHGGNPPTGYSTLEQPAISTGTGPAISAQQEYVESHKALQKYTVFDAQCGIFLENFGITEDLWDKSIWNILGWDYQQLTSDKQTSYDIDKGPTGALNRQYRLTRTNSHQILGLTTNADVGLNDIPLYKMNVWNKSQYTLQMPVPMEPDLWYGWMSQASSDTTLYSNTKLYRMLDDIHGPVVYPTIVVTQTSTNLTANNLPIKMTLPYYLIKSNIISDSYYIKDKTPLPIVSVVNKENFSGQSILEFTITQPTTLSFIRTEIFDADMSYAKVDKNSAVIYKVEKQVPQNLDLAQEVLQAAQSKKQSKKTKSK
jgi:hypothetical protein